VEVTILLVDDHPMFRQGLRALLDGEEDLRVVGEAGDGREAMDRVRELSPDVVVMDISMPDLDGITATRQILAESPETRVMALSIHSGKRFVQDMLRAGAVGYVLKESAPEELVRAVKQVLQGGKYVSASIAERLLREQETGPQGLPHETLSDREYQVLCLIGSGKTVTQIGEDLGLSVKTVATYRSRLLTKMSMSNSAEIIAYAIRHGLVPCSHGMRSGLGTVPTRNGTATDQSNSVLETPGVAPGTPLTSHDACEGQGKKTGTHRSSHNGVLLASPLDAGHSHPAAVCQATIPSSSIIARSFSKAWF